MTDQPTDRLTLDEAAAALGISREAVRLRVRRGTLRGERSGGIWYVSLVGRSPTDQATERPTDRPRYTRRRDGAERDELVQHLRDEVAFLRRLTEHQAGVIAAYQRQLAPPAAEDVTVPIIRAESPATMPHSAPEMAEKSPTPRRWWQRLFHR